MNRYHVSLLASLLIGLSIVLIALSLLGQIVGFELGYSSALDLEFPRSTGEEFIAHGPNFYASVRSFYLLVAAFGGVFLALRSISGLLVVNGKSRSIRYVLLALEVSILVVVALVLGNMARYKMDVMENEFTDLPYSAWLTGSIWWDYLIAILLALLALLTLVEAIGIFRRRQLPKNEK